MVTVDNGESVEKESKVGTPWTILPIKNKKYAKDLVEVHLSNRGLTSLERFEEFPNLEVIWLNGNEVSEKSRAFARILPLFHRIYDFAVCYSYKIWTISSQTLE